MFYRRKFYIVKKEIVESFNTHFNQTLLPTQLKYGSRIIGRWMAPLDQDHVELFAIWEYDSREAYVEIEAKVRGDQEHFKRVLEWYEKHGGRENVLKQFIIEVRDQPIESTIISNV